MRTKYTFDELSEAMDTAGLSDGDKHRVLCALTTKPKPDTFEVRHYAVFIDRTGDGLTRIGDIVTDYKEALANAKIVRFNHPSAKMVVAQRIKTPRI